jgi:Flp pilus assembly protein TadD
MRSVGVSRCGWLAATVLTPCIAAGLAGANGSEPGNTPVRNDQEAVRTGAPALPTGISLAERADIYMARKMFREAIETYGKIQPITAATLNKIGIAYQQQFEPEEAQKYYGQAIQLDPNFAEAINNLGTVFYMRRDYRRATKLYKHALKLEPLSATIHINLGMVWLAQHNDKEWQSSFQRALELNPEVLDRRDGYGVMIEERSPVEKAKFNLYMARLQARRGNNEAALQYIRKAMESGFRDRQKLLEDADFAAVRRLPGFDELMKQPPKVL